MTASRQSTGAASARHSASFRDALGWELRKLVALSRTRWALACCVIVPVIAVVAVKGQQRPPKDSLFGRHIHDSGYAVPLLILGFAAQWAFPLLPALVAGDIFASEDHLGTWKTVLTRSVSRAQLFWAKTLTAVLFAVTVTALIAAVTIGASVLFVGRQDLRGLSGQIIPSGTALRLVIASWGTALAPMLGFMTITDTKGNDVPNPVFEFDVCFDPHSSNTPTGVVIPPPAAPPAAK